MFLRRKHYMVRRLKYFLIILLFAPLSAKADVLTFPAYGHFNGFLNQLNVLECENSGSSALQLRLKLRRSNGSLLAQTNFSVSAFGAKHIVLGGLVNIINRYGTYELTSSQSGIHLSCRTAFYRYAAQGSGKLLDYAYVLPVRNGRTGPLSGIFNSFNPSLGSTPTYNWLSIVNLSSQPFSAVVKRYHADGTPGPSTTLSPLPPRARVDLPLGHDQGQTNGIYVIRPADNSQSYDAFLIRYASNSPPSYDFAFPLESHAASCTTNRVLLSTMGNGLTDNWLEIGNPSSHALSISIALQNRNGGVLHRENRVIPRYGQLALYVNSTIDPTHRGNVGSATVTCSDTTKPLLLQSAYYGHRPGVPAVQWAYVEQAPNLLSAGSTKQLTVPVNTYQGMANWMKLVNLSPSTSAGAKNTLFNDRGTAVWQQTISLPRRGTNDIDLHSHAGFNALGSFMVSVNSAGFTGELLRVLSDSNNEIQTIVNVPASVQAKVQVPTPTSGYFPPGSTWYQDISAAALDPQSAEVISWLSSAGGWGGGNMQIDFSIEVVQADGTVPLLPFVQTGDFFDPDCDYTPVPLPPGGALEGETGYQCLSDGDCHLIVVHQPSKRLFEMWRANIVGDTFYGGCLAVWDMTRIYGPSGRGENCTSADAGGLPIAPLLFTADEVARGSINHALRFILPNSRIRDSIYVHPATHSTGATSGPSSAPPYGVRLRLRADYPLSGLPNDAARTVARAMQHYGIILADGGTIALTAQSDRFSTAKWDTLLDSHDLSQVQVTDFEMINAGTRYNYTGDCVRVP